MTVIAATLFCTANAFPHAPEAGQVAATASPSEKLSFYGGDRSWLAGDHHTHSHHSMKWDTTTSPPTPILAGDAHYSRETNARMALANGLSWLVVTDHGGPDHSKINLEQAYPELLASRDSFPQLIQFYGMELDTPGARHSSVIVPRSSSEGRDLATLEKSYSRREVFPHDPARDTEKRMLEALITMKSMNKTPILFVNHPGRTATGPGEYSDVSPEELRNWNDTAPKVAIGMEGAPGHQAATLNQDGTINSEGIRAIYDNFPTMGGFDQMTARVGGFWDSMLSEGRQWWITSNSDSHVHYTDGGADFWPGEYSKTHVYAEKSYDDILSSLRNGHIFVTTGDLISELFVTASVRNREQTAGIGDTITVRPGTTIDIQVKFLDPDGTNASGQNPQVERVDVISGPVTEKQKDKSSDSSPYSSVTHRFFSQSWEKHGPYSVAHFSIEQVSESFYLRIRGTNTDELEPEPDAPGEDPWSDLWFYSNPIFIHVAD